MFQSNFGNDSHNLASQFGAAGGFVPSPAQDAGQATQAAKRFGSNTQTLRAVTIKQIAEAVENTPDDNIKIDGEELHNILLVARVEAVRQLSTCLELEVDDGTGTMEVKLYIDEDEASAPAKLQDCKEGSYVRIHGHLRPMDNKYPLVAFSVKPLTDHNEVTYHLLNCIYQHASLTRGTQQQSRTAPTQQAGTAGVQGFGGQGMEIGGSDAQLSHPDPKLNALQQVMNQTQRDMTVEEVQQAMKGAYSVGQIKQMLDQLTEYGFVYSAIPDHFKSCQC